VLLPRQRLKLARGANDKEHTMSQNLSSAIAVAGIDIGKNSFHIVGLDARGAIVLRQKWSRGQVEARRKRPSDSHATEKGDELDQRIRMMAYAH
jgi:transposase